MATSSIFHNVVIDTEEAAERFVDALEKAERWNRNKTKLKNGDKVQTIYGDEVVIVDIGKESSELTLLDREIQIGFYKDGVPCRNKFIVTGELYHIVEKRI